MNSQYFIDCLKSIQDNHNDFTVTAHNINSISPEGQINYNREDVLALSDAHKRNEEKELQNNK